jgi:hypothetical protein
VSHESILTSLAQLERLIRKGLSMGSATEEELDAYALALREAVDGYIYALGRSGGLAIPSRQTDRYFAEYD